MIYAGERGLGGIVALDAAAGAPSHWIAYVTVDEVDAAAKRGEAAGGATCVPADADPQRRPLRGA